MEGTPEEQLPEPFGKPLPLGMGMDRKQPVLGLDVAPSKMKATCKE
jgi:hypothetical protein